MENELKISDEIKLEILKKYIEPSYTDDVDNLIRGRKCWRITGQIFETISKLLVAAGGIVSFSSGYFSYPVLGFIAGGISTVSLAMLQFSSFSYSENKKQAQELNIILKKLNVDTIPVLERNNDVVSMKLVNRNTYENSYESDRKEILNEIERQRQEFEDRERIRVDEINNLRQIIENKNNGENNSNV